MAGRTARLRPGPRAAGGAAPARSASAATDRGAPCAVRAERSGLQERGVGQRITRRRRGLRGGGGPVPARLYPAGEAALGRRCRGGAARPSGHPQRKPLTRCRRYSEKEPRLRYLNCHHRGSDPPPRGRRVAAGQGELSRNRGQMWPERTAGHAGAPGPRAVLKTRRVRGAPGLAVGPVRGRVVLRTVALLPAAGGFTGRSFQKR